jgi:hypothetical protein
MMSSSVTEEAYQTIESRRLLLLYLPLRKFFPLASVLILFHGFLGIRKEL